MSRGRIDRPGENARSYATDEALRSIRVMSYPNRRTFLSAIVLSAAVLATGCMATPRFMRETANHPPTSDPQGAVVVFVRPSSYGAQSIFRIMNGAGVFVGDSRASSWFAVRMPPGKHTFIGVGENTAPMVANLAAGRIYFVEVSAKMGAWSGPRVHLFRLAPGTDNWPRVREWLRTTTRFEPDYQGGQASILPEERAKRIGRAREHLSNYDADELAARTLQTTDGVETY